jgi:hypothetical protein
VIVRYADSGWSQEEWQLIEDAMRKHVPDPRAWNVFRRGGGPVKPAPEPSIASLLASRQVRGQLAKGPRQKQKQTSSLTSPEKHPCALCGRQISVSFKFCRRCSGKTPRANVDALDRRLPGSFEGGKRR